MDWKKKQGLYWGYGQQKGENSKSQRSPIATLDELEYEISLLEDELEELKAYKKKLEENVDYRKKVSQNLELHKYCSGIVVISIMENEVVFEFNAMVVNRCTESYCVRIADLDNGSFSVLKYYMPVYMDLRGLLKKPELQNDIEKYLNYVHSCLVAYNDRKHQVMQAERSFNKNGIKIANTLDYRLLEITFNIEENKNKIVTVVVVLKYEDNEVRPRSISVECEDLNKATSEEIKAQLNDLQIYSLEVGLQLSLLKNESSTQSLINLSNVDSEASLESATTMEFPQSNHRRLEVDLGMYKRIRGRGRGSLQQRSVESELETSEEEEDQNKQKPRRGRGSGSRGRGRGKHVPFSKQIQAESGNTERGVSRRGRGRSDRRGSKKGKTLDISKYFKQSNPT